MEYAEAYQEALNEPMMWVRMDSDMLRDMKVRKLMRVGGFQYLGMYVALVMGLAQADGHIYDMRDGGWDYLQADMSNGGCPVDPDELSRFVNTVASVGLCDAEMWAESRKLTSKRLIREVERNAQSAAKSRMKLDAMNAARAKKQ